MKGGMLCNKRAIHEGLEQSGVITYYMKQPVPYYGTAQVKIFMALLIDELKKMYPYHKTERHIPL